MGGWGDGGMGGWGDLTGVGLLHTLAEMAFFRRQLPLLSWRSLRRARLIIKLSSGAAAALHQGEENLKFRAGSGLLFSCFGGIAFRSAAGESS